MGKKDLNPFVVVAKKKKKKKKKKKHRKKEESDSDSSLSSAVEDGALAKDETDVKIFEEMFMKRNTDKVVADASVYDRFSDNEESEEEEGPRLGPGLVKKISGVDLNTKKKGKEKKSSKKSSKKSKKKKKKEKEKKKKKKKKKKTASSDDDNPSDSDDAKESIPRIDLKAAFLAIDGLLGTAESMKEELSGMLGHIDSGEELEISGIPNPDIQKYLGVLFKAMLFKRGDEGGWQRSGNTPKLLPLFRPNIERFVFVKKKKSERSGKREKPRVTAEHEQSDSKPTEVIKKGRVGKEMDKIIGKIEDEAVQKAKPKRQARAGPMMPSAAEMEEAKKLVDARGWENQPEDDPDDSDDLGPTLPGQNSEAKEQALEQLRRVREIAIERKKQEALKPKHEGWMTVMPEERRMDSSLDQRGRTFSMKGVQKRGDTSEWTMTPEERRRKQAEKLLEMHQPPAGSKRKRGTLRFKGQDEDEEKPKAYIPVLDKSGKSLLDMHQNERSKTKKRQIGGTRNFSLKSMREDRRFNKKEADGMKSMGKKLTMSFGAGQLYKSQM